MGHEIPKTIDGWYSRGYLPHFEAIGTIQSVMFRLGDSLPHNKLEQLELELATMSKTGAELERRKHIEKWLDAGSGSCVLRHPQIAQMVENTLLRLDGDRYRLIAWCIMPNHVHVLVEPLAPLSSIVQSWKSYTGRAGRKISYELGFTIPEHGFWMREYWDRFIRNEQHFQQVITYIHENPVKAGLCDVPEAWQWSSAFGGNP